MAGWGVTDRRTARRAGIEWPDQDRRASYDDIWTWQDVHVKFAEQLEQSHPTEAALINATRASHSDGLAAYLSYMVVRLLEMRRVLKSAGALYLHCDYTANSYLRLLLDTVFGKDNLRREIFWQRAGGRAKGSQHARKTFGADTDTILFYSKTPASRLTDGEQPLSTLWADVPNLTSSRERTGYPTQKPVALAERIIQSFSRPGDVVLDPFAGCAYVPVAAESLGRPPHRPEARPNRKGEPSHHSPATAGRAQGRENCLADSPSDLPDLGKTQQAAADLTRPSLRGNEQGGNLEGVGAGAENGHFPAGGGAGPGDEQHGSPEQVGDQQIHRHRFAVQGAPRPHQQGSSPGMTGMVYGPQRSLRHVQRILVGVDHFYVTLVCHCPLW